MNFLENAGMLLLSQYVAGPSPVNMRVLHRAQDLRNSKCIQDECYRTLKHFCATSLYETFPQYWALRAILNSQEEGSERERGQQNKNINSFFQLCCRNVFSGLGLCPEFFLRHEASVHRAGPRGQKQMPDGPHFTTRSTQPASPLRSVRPYMHASANTNS